MSVNNNIPLSDAGCQNKRKLCLCDGLCGMSCVRCVITSLHDMTLHHSCDHHDDIFRPEKECPELPDPDNGQVHLTGRNFQVSGIVTFLTSIIIVTFLTSIIIVTVQDRAVYTCDGGYRLVGVEKVRVS